MTAAAELFRRGVTDHVRALAAWCVGAAAYIGLVAAIFPSVKGSADLTQLVESYPEALKSLFGISGDLGTGIGYVDAELFSFMLPLLALVLAIGAGARAIAGEEDAGRLELMLAYPVRRRGAVYAQGAALATQVAVFCGALLAALALLDPAVGLDLPYGRLAAGLLGVALVAVLHGWIALAVGAAVPSRTLAIGVPAALAAVEYLIDGLHGLASWLDPFRVASAFWWVSRAPLQDGVSGWGLLVVACAAVAVLGAGAALLERRDVHAP